MRRAQRASSAGRRLPATAPGVRGRRRAPALLVAAATAVAAAGVTPVAGAVTPLAPPDLPPVAATVTAVAAGGDTLAAEASPPQPTVTDLVATTRSISVDWDPPAGVAVDSWTVQLAGPIPSRRTVRGDITALTFSGLAPATPHSLTIIGYPAGVVTRLRVPVTTLPIVPAPRLGRVVTSETGLRVEFFRPTVRATAVEALTFVDYVVVAGDRTQIVPDEPGQNRYVATFNDLPAGSTVSIRVTARVDRAADAESATSSTRATLRTETPPIARLTPRSGAVSVAVHRRTTASSVTAAGGSTAAPITGYEITVGPTTVVAKANGRALLTGLAGTTTYPVSVVILRDDLRSVPFVVGEVTTLAAEAPQPPQNVRMMLPNARQPVFRWDPAPAGSVDRYELYADDRLEATVDGSASSVGIRTSSLLPAPTSFRLVAVNSIGSAETSDIERVRSFGR